MTHIPDTKIMRECVAGGPFVEVSLCDAVSDVLNYGSIEHQISMQRDAIATLADALHRSGRLTESDIRSLLFNDGNWGYSVEEK